MARNFSTRLGSRTCKRPTRRTRRQSTWSPLGEKLHREWMTYYCWRCVHKTGTTPMMSTHGKVTDFQMWDEVLPDEQLLKVLEKNSELFQLSLFWRSLVVKSSPRATWSAGRKPTGSWTQVVARFDLHWLILTSNQPTNQAREETLDLEKDVCRSRSLSLHMVPYKLKVKGF